MKKRVRIPIISGLFFLLILVRAFGADIFYDPFIEYFKNDYLSKPIPDYNGLKLSLNILFRYALNTIISLAIIYFSFQKKGLVKFSIKFYTAALIALGLLYFILLQFEMLNGHLFTFYVRRFLIHPVFVLILLPAFYYQKKLIRVR